MAESATLPGGAAMTLKVGLIVGREWSFPPAFIEEVNRRDEDVTAELVKLGAARMDEPCDYAVIIDRISHEVPYYRTYLKYAALRGATIINNPFMWTADDKFFEAASPPALTSPAPRPSPSPTRTTSPASSTTKACATSSIPSIGRASWTTSACPVSSKMPTAAAGKRSTSATPWTS